MAKHDEKSSELERVARAGWMVTLRYRLLVSATQAPSRPARWRWMAGGASAVTLAAGFVKIKLGWL
jgi:hypothetical protein